jgi:hypothetical protein
MGRGDDSYLCGRRPGRAECGSSTEAALKALDAVGIQGRKLGFERGHRNDELHQAQDAGWRPADERRGGLRPFPLPAGAFGGITTRVTVPLAAAAPPGLKK